MKCPNCEKDVEKEDDTCSTDRGTMGGVYWWCEDCGDVTELIEND